MGGHLCHGRTATTGVPLLSSSTLGANEMGRFLRCGLSAAYGRSPG